jgi:hypothetical protein
MENSKINLAKVMFGDEVISTVLETVSMSDADGAYTLFEDMGHFDHADCVEFLYFES